MGRGRRTKTGRTRGRRRAVQTGKPAPPAQGPEPKSLPQGILALYALAFGPLSQREMAEACRLAGLKAPNGSVVTEPKATAVTKALA